jgi:hypothetical protein
LTFDNIDEPVSFQYAHITVTGVNPNLQRNLDYVNGYSHLENDLDYNVVEKEHFTHNNMIPNTSKRDYAINDSKVSRKLEAFTGVNEYYVPKQEKYKLFEPMRNLTYVIGMPVVTDYLDDRYLPSNKNNNGNLPFTNNVKVRPGLENENRLGLGTVYRVIPRSTDALRGEHRQKITYLNKPLETKKMGEYRGPDFNLTKYKLPDFRETDFGDLIPGKAQIEGHKKTGKYTNVSSQRGEHDTYYGGHAANGNMGDGPATSKSRFEPSKKQSLFNDPTHAVNAVNVRPVHTNKESWANKENQRTTTNISQNGVAYRAEGGVNVLPTDKARKTVRETTSHDVVLGAKGEVNTGKYKPTDKAKKTIRETTSHDIVLNTKPENASGNVQPTDKAKKTIRETTNHDIVLNTKPENTGGALYLTDKGDKAKKTIRETTNHDIVLNTKPENMGGALYLTDKGDKAKKTIRETTNYDIVLNAKPENTGGALYLTDKGDKAKKTIRETTNYDIVLNAKPENTGGALYLTDKGDKAKKTIRETTNYDIVLNAKPENTGGAIYLTDKGDKAKPTIRESTTHGIILNAKPENASGNVQLTDKAKKTIRETTSHDIVLNAKPENASGNVQPSDKAKPTIKQTTLYSTPGMNVGSTVPTGYSKDDEDKAKPTIRETTENNKFNGTLHGADTYLGWVKDDDDIAKSTIRQSTTVATPGMNVGTNVPAGYSHDQNDEARPTIRQLTDDNNYQGPLGGADNYAGYIIQDEAKTTIKQTTLLTDYTGQVSANVEQPKSTMAADNMTIRETREISTYNRTPGGGANLAGPQINKKTVKMNCKKDSVYYVPHPSRPLDQNIMPSNAEPYHKHTYVIKKPQINYGDYYTNNVFINTLKDNPLVNDIYHQKNVQYDQYNISK